MEKIQVKDRFFKLYMPESEIQKYVKAVADRISHDYKHKKPILCPVLTGSYLFVADLTRYIEFDAEVSFVRYSSYDGMSSTGKVKKILGFPEKCKGRDVIIVEDIVDSGLSMKYMIEELTRIPVEVEYSSEFRYRNPVIYPDDVVIAISQSGETADTLAAMQLAKASGAFLFGICNVVGSSIARAADTGCYTHAGPEIGVASTKAFTAQVETLLLLALNIAQEKGTVSDELRKRIIAELPRIPDKIEKILRHDKQISELAKTFTYAHNFIYLGRGYNYPIALEGALKLKEISYIHAEGYPAAEMKHGPIALIDEEMPVVVIAPKRGHYDKILSNIQEVKARKGRVISIVTEGDKDVKGISDYSFEIPDTEECLVPLLSVIPLQLLAYHIAIAKGRDVDQPRNLAKSVTVE